VSVQSKSYDLQQFDREIGFAKRFSEHGVSIFEGRTDPNERRERIRDAIIDCGLGETTIWKHADGRCETYRQAFERFYGEPLEAKSQERKSA
jgi:hypothetical protein